MFYFREELCGIGSRVEVLYNWLNINDKPKSDSGWRQRLGLDGKVVFFYGGNIGVAQDMDNIVRLAVGLREHEDIFFLLIGSGSEVKRLNAKIELLGLGNIKIYPPLPQKEYMECLSEFDVGMVSLDRRLKSNNYTGKLLGYVLCGKPILASVSSSHDLLGLLNSRDAGIACVNGEDDQLRAAALLLASDGGIRERMGSNSRALGENLFSVRVIAQQILLSVFGASGNVENTRNRHSLEGEFIPMILPDQNLKGQRMGVRNVVVTGANGFIGRHLCERDSLPRKWRSAPALGRRRMHNSSQASPLL